MPTDQAIIAIAAVMLLDGALDRDLFQIVIYAAGVGVAAVMDDVDAALRGAFEPIFATPIGAAAASAPQDISGRAR